MISKCNCLFMSNTSKINLVRLSRGACSSGMSDIIRMYDDIYDNCINKSKV